ncbi:MAG: sugar ABC transporter permease [Treponema sp.]|jgi:putative multiple sugar transport system permease protein|nr:sugar ABC transporter permease [Treponema sp.]
MSDKTMHTTDVKSLIKNNIRNYSMFIMLVVIMIIFAVLTNGVNLYPRNFINIFFQNSYVLILAVGMVMIIITQNIDLSVGAVCAFVGALSAMVYNLLTGIPWMPSGIAMVITILASIAMGVVIGAYQGSWVAFGKMPAFIVTLSGMLLFRGLTYIVTSISTGAPTPVSLSDTGYSLMATGVLDEVLKTKKIGPYLPLSFIAAIIILAFFFVASFIGRKKKIDNDFEVAPLPLFITKLVIISVLVLGLAERFARDRGLPIIVLVLGITIFAFHFILKNTVFGRYIYAVGGNPRSAKLSGINSEMVIFIVFCFMGGLTGLAAVVFTGYMNSALPQSGNLFELDAIAACYIGGVSAGGGIGTVVGVIIGGLVMAAINNGMVIMNMSNHLQYVVKALVLILAVFYDVYTRRKSGLG